MLAFPNCKINLGLSIVEKRPDGYHNIETVFYPIPLHDALEIIPAKDGKTEFFSSGIPIPGSVNQNLCLKAYQLLKNDFDLPAIKIHLHKVIPMGAGLGGGSSDAAQTLLVLNQLFELGLTQDKLLQYASRLGADCAFFILNKPLYATQRGDHFSEVELSLKGCFIVLVKPDVHSSTADAYAGVSPEIRLFSPNQLIKKPIEEWRLTLFNDFEKSIFEKFPIIEQIKEKLYDKGALYASMSGSGSSLFGIFKENINLSEEFKTHFYWTSRI